MKLTLTQTHWITAIVSTVALIPPVWPLSCGRDAGLAPMAWLFSGRAFADRPLIMVIRVSLEKT